MEFHNRLRRGRNLFHSHRQMGVYFPCPVYSAAVDFFFTPGKESIGSLGLLAFSDRRRFDGRIVGSYEYSDYPLGKCNRSCEKL